MLNLAPQDQRFANEAALNDPILTSLGELQNRVFQEAKQKLTSLHSVVQFPNSQKAFDRSDISSQYNTVSDQEMALRRSEMSGNLEEGESKVLLQPDNSKVGPNRSSQNLCDSVNSPYLYAEYHSLLEGMKKKGIPIDAERLEGLLSSNQSLRKMSNAENPMMIKRKKKKGKKKTRTTAELQLSNLSGSNKSCHNRCKEQYEASSKGSLRNLGGFLQCSPMYQQFHPKYLDMITPMGSNKKLPVKAQSKREMNYELSPTNTSSKRKTSKKALKKNNAQTVGKNQFGTSGIKTNKSLAVIKQSDSSRDQKGPSSGRKSLEFKKINRTNSSSKLLSGAKENIRESLHILQPRYSLAKSSKPNSKRSIPTFTDVLYHQGLERERERERVAQESRMKRLQDELSECTFQPAISELARKKSNPE